MAENRTELLWRLFDELIVQLTNKIKDGSASAADFSNAIKLLKDNNISVDMEGGGEDAMKELLGAIEGFRPPIS